VLDQVFAPQRFRTRTRQQSAAILSVATELPSERLTSAEIADRLGIS
jgi:hypothetical protein